MTFIFILLTVQIFLGALDNLWHHELSERLPARRSARYEILLHAMRESLYALIFICLAWTAMQGTWGWLLVGLFTLELAVTLADFVIEDRTRRLPAFERVLHTILAVNLGAFFALYLPHAVREGAQPTSIIWVNHGYWSAFLTVAAIVVFAWSIRNWIAAAHWLRAPYWQVNPIRVGQANETKHLLITGASGFIGRTLVARILARGHRVTVLTREYDKAWYFFGHQVRIVTDLDQINANDVINTVVNLAGAPVIGGLWTAKRKRKLIDSRVAVTDAIILLANRLATKPELMISASAIGYYGIHGEKRLIEADGPGEGFQAELTMAWESTAEQIELLGTRLVKMRLGLVLGAQGGIFPRLVLPLFCRINVVFGRGTHWISWVHLEDVIGLIMHAMENKKLRGAINVTAPEPVKHADFMGLFAKKLGVVITLRIPTKLLRACLGELAQLFVDGQKVMPLVAQSHGYKFRYAKLSHAGGELLRKKGMEKPKIVYFDGAVPLCAKEIAVYKHACEVENIAVEFQNLDHSPRSLENFGLSVSTARRRLYVLTTNGKLVSGVEALLTIWQSLRGFRWLARAARVPGIHGSLAIFYDLLVAPLISFWSTARRKKVHQELLRVS